MHRDRMCPRQSNERSEEVQSHRTGDEDGRHFEVLSESEEVFTPQPIKIAEVNGQITKRDNPDGRDKSVEAEADGNANKQDECG